MNLDTILALMLSQGDVQAQIIKRKPEIGTLGPNEEKTIEVKFSKNGFINTVYVEGEGNFDLEIFDSLNGDLFYKTARNTDICYDVLNIPYISGDGDKLFLHIKNNSNENLEIKKTRIMGLKI